MTIIIKKGESQSEIEAAKKRLQKTQKRPMPIDFYGKLKGAFGDGLDYQKKLRNEWS